MACSAAAGAGGRAACRASADAEHRLRLALVARRLVRQVGDLRDVGELAGERRDLRVALLRVHVVRDEVLLEPGGVLRRAVADPLLDRERRDVAVRSRDADERRHRRADRRRVAQAEPGDVVQVRGGRDVGVEQRRQVAAAELLALRRRTRPRRAAGRCSCSVGGAGHRGLRGGAFDREPASAGVLPVVGVLRADRAQRRRSCSACRRGAVERRAWRRPRRRSSSGARRAARSTSAGVSIVATAGYPIASSCAFSLGRGDDRRLDESRPSTDRHRRRRRSPS